MLFAYSCFITSVFSVGLGIFVYLKGPQKPANLLWFIMCISISVWALGLGMTMCTPSLESALRWTRLQYVGCNMIPVLFLHFVMKVLNIPSNRFLKINYGIAVLLQLLSLTGLLESVAPHPPYTYYTARGPFYELFVAYFFESVVVAHWLVWREMRAAKGRMKLQLKYVFVGMSIGFTGGATSFFPVYNMPIPPYGVYAVPLYVLMIGYAIFKHQLMDIAVVIRKTLIYSLASAALAAIYVGLVTGLVNLFQGIVGHITLISSTLAAGLMGALFHPVSSRVQAFVDARFFRKRIDRESRIMEFSNAVARGEDLQKMTESLCQIVGETLHPTSLALYLLAEDGSEYLQVSPDAQIALPKRMPRVNAWSQYFDDHAKPLISETNMSSANSEKEALIVGDAIKQMVDAHQAAAFPLMHQESLLGFLLLGEKASGERYGDEDLLLIQIIMNQATLAFERPKLLNEITGAFVHEVKMPLANISLPAELSYMDLQDVEGGKKELSDLLPKLKKRMKYIMEQASLAGGRMEAIREISRDQSIIQTEVSLAQVIQDSVRSLESLLLRSGIHLQVDLPDIPASVAGNAKQLEIVIVNLLKNGIEAVQSAGRRNGGSELHIRLRAELGDVVMEIQDSGAGIKDADIPQLFKSHFTTKGTRGLGLGLYVSRQIINAHQGHLTFESQEGQGTTFTVRMKAYQRITP